MKALNRFYVYILYRPWDMTPCYVGKGQGGRVSEHFRLAKNGRHRNSHLANIIKKAGGTLPFDIAAQNLTNEDAFSIEKRLIEEFGRKHNGGPLCNMTDGGEGPLGMSLESRERISKKLTGRKMNEATRAKVSASLKTSEKAARHVREMAEYRRGRPLTDDHKNAIRCARIAGGYSPTPEHRANMSVAQSRRNHGPMSPEALERRREKTKDFVVSDATKEKLRQAALAQHARRRAGKELTE